MGFRTSGHVDLLAAGQGEEGTVQPYVADLGAKFTGMSMPMPYHALQGRPHTSPGSMHLTPAEAPLVATPWLCTCTYTHVMMCCTLQPVPHFLPTSPA